jgi:hypothetical protein
MTFEPPAPPPDPAPGSAPSDPFAQSASPPLAPAPPPVPPAAPAPPPRPAPAQWSAPPAGGPTGASATFNPATVNPLDWGILAAGFFALIFSFVSYYTVTLSLQGISRSGSETAWHGFFGWFGALIALAAAGLLAVHIFLPSAKLPVPVRLTVLGGFALALLCIIIAAFVTPGAHSSKELSAAAGLRLHVDYGRGAGFWLSLIVILAGTVMAFLRLRDSGGKLPWEGTKA